MKKLKNTVEPIVCIFLLIFGRTQARTYQAFDTEIDEPIAGESPVTAPLITERDEQSAQQCAAAIDSPLLAAAAQPAPSPDSTKFAASLNGIWTSVRCEIAPGPEFTYRRYVFYTTSQDGENPIPPNPANADEWNQLSSRLFFRSIHFKFADPDCQIPIFAFNAEGELTVVQSLSRQLFSSTPGGEETEISIFRVSITVFNASAFLASNYSVFSIQQPLHVTPPSTDDEKLTMTLAANHATTTSIEQPDDDEESKRERKATRFRPTCNMSRLWPHLAQQLPILAKNSTITDSNLLVFEMYNEIDQSPDMFQWPPEPINSRPQTRILDEVERGKNEDRLDCLKKAGFNVDELLLLRIDKRRVFHEKKGEKKGSWAELAVLKTGQIFRGIFGELNYKPSMYAANLLFQYKPQPFMASICPLCATLGQNDIEENCYSKFFVSALSLQSKINSIQTSAVDASFLLPSIRTRPVQSVRLYEETIKNSERWVSTRCETRPYGVFLMRQIIFSPVSSALFRGLFLYFEDPMCTIPTYDLEIGGDFRLVRGVFNPFPGPESRSGRNNGSIPFGAAYLFNTNWARIRPRNFQAVTTLSEYSHAGNCGRATRWRLHEWQDVSPTGGCLAIGIRVPTEELQIIRLESSSDASNSASFLYVGDAQSKRPLSPSLMAPSAISTNSYGIGGNGFRESTSAEVKIGVDLSLFELIRPTSFLEPLIRCRDLITIYNDNYAKISSKNPPTTTSSVYIADNYSNGDNDEAPAMAPPPQAMTSSNPVPQVPASLANTQPIETPEVYYYQGNEESSRANLLDNIDKDVDVPDTAVPTPDVKEDGKYGPKDGDVGVVKGPIVSSTPRPKGSRGRNSAVTVTPFAIGTASLCILLQFCLILL